MTPTGAWRARTPDEEERGSGTVLVLALCGILGLSTVAAVGVAGAAGARHRAGSAADLAALGGAPHLPDVETACRLAGRVAAASGARLASCTAEGDVLEVSATVGMTGWAGRLPPATGRARATTAG